MTLVWASVIVRRAAKRRKLIARGASPWNGVKQIAKPRQGRKGQCRDCIPARFLSTGETRTPWNEIQRRLGLSPRPGLGAVSMASQGLAPLATDFRPCRGWADGLAGRGTKRNVNRASAR